MYSLNKIKKPNFIFAEAIESGAMDQFIETMKQPSVVRGALMPDAHQGYTVPIGCVFETDGVVFPSAVGFDVGCGCCAVPTSFNYEDVVNNAQAIYKSIMKHIPVGFNHRNRPVKEVDLLNFWKCTPDMENIFKEKGGYNQLGTLGGGK